MKKKLVALCLMSIILLMPTFAMASSLRSDVPVKLVGGGIETDTSGKQLHTWVYSDGSTRSWTTTPNSISALAAHVGPNGERVNHTSSWQNTYTGTQYATADTSAFTKNGASIYHYTTVHVVNTWIPSRIIEDSGRKWGWGYSSASSKAVETGLEFSMRSYFGGVW